MCSSDLQIAGDPRFPDAIALRRAFPVTIAALHSPGARVTTILLLIASNIFMTAAWYGHLRYTESPLWIVILASWGIAFFEYCLQVPANRWGYGEFTGAQLKVIQEVISLLVFAGFSVWWLGEALRWNHLGAFFCLVGAVWFMFAA